MFDELARLDRINSVSRIYVVTIGSATMTTNRLVSAIVLAAAVILSAPGLASAHPGHPGHGAGFHDGWQHPLQGLDHLLAMVAVGLLAVRVGGRGIWLVPCSFLVAMLLGGFAGSAGWNLPGVETGILTSVIVLGAMVAAASAAPIAIATAIVAVFAFFHGFAHGSEMSSGGSMAAYAIGFLLATAALHLAGIGAAAGAKQLSRPVSTAPARITRVAGAAIAACGLLMLVGLV
jgi:urease accessory protein